MYIIIYYWTVVGNILADGCIQCTLKFPMNFKANGLLFQRAVCHWIAMSSRDWKVILLDLKLM